VLLHPRDLQEDLLEIRDAGAVGLDPQFNLLRVDLREEHRELVCRGEGHLDEQLLADSRHDLGLIAHHGLHRLQDLAVDGGALRVLGEGDDVAAAEPLLQKVRGAAARQLALGHDRDAVAEGVCLVHVVRRQAQDVSCAPALQRVPHAAARERVHATRRLVEDHQIGLRKECEGATQLPLHASRERGAPGVDLVEEGDGGQQLATALHQALLRHAADGAEELQVLEDRELIHEHVVLRAEAHV